MRIFGLGDLGNLGSTWPSNTPEVESCGPSPCSWWDNVWARDACVQYMQCAIPNDASTVALTDGVVTGVATEVGDVAGGVVSGAASGLAGNTSFSGAILLAAVAVAGVLILTRR